MRMIEKVAKGMFESNSGHSVKMQFNDALDVTKNMYKELAKAAIEAMREPTNDMANEYFKLRKEVGDIDATACFNVSVWQTMIDAALKE